jgi:hypothetical protein
VPKRKTLKAESFLSKLQWAQEKFSVHPGENSKETSLEQSDKVRRKIRNTINLGKAQWRSRTSAKTKSGEQDGMAEIRCWCSIGGSLEMDEDGRTKYRCFHKGLWRSHVLREKNGTRRIVGKMFPSKQSLNVIRIYGIQHLQC